MFFIDDYDSEEDYYDSSDEDALLDHFVTSGYGYGLSAHHFDELRCRERSIGLFGYNDVASSSTTPVPKIVQQEQQELVTDAILEHIFRFLTGVQLAKYLVVCKRWKHLIDSEEKWKIRLDIEFHKRRDWGNSFWKHPVPSESKIQQQYPKFLNYKQKYSLRISAQLRKCGLCYKKSDNLYNQSGLSFNICSDCIRKHYLTTEAAKREYLLNKFELQECAFLDTHYGVSNLYSKDDIIEYLKSKYGDVEAELAKRKQPVTSINKEVIQKYIDEKKQFQESFKKILLEKGISQEKADELTQRVPVRVDLKKVLIPTEPRPQNASTADDEVYDLTDEFVDRRVKTENKSKEETLNQKLRNKLQALRTELSIRDHYIPFDLLEKILKHKPTTFAALKKLDKVPESFIKNCGIQLISLIRVFVEEELGEEVPPLTSEELRAVREHLEAEHTRKKNASLLDTHMHLSELLSFRLNNYSLITSEMQDEEQLSKSVSEYANKRNAKNNVLNYLKEVGYNFEDKSLTATLLKKYTSGALTSHSKTLIKEHIAIWKKEKLFEEEFNKILEKKSKGKYKNLEQLPQIAKKDADELISRLPSHFWAVPVEDVDKKRLEALIDETLARIVPYAEKEEQFIEELRTWGYNYNSMYLPKLVQDYCAGKSDLTFFQTVLKLIKDYKNMHANQYLILRLLGTMDASIKRPLIKSLLKTLAQQVKIQAANADKEDDDDEQSNEKKPKKKGKEKASAQPTSSLDVLELLKPKQLETLYQEIVVQLLRADPKFSTSYLYNRLIRVPTPNEVIPLAHVQSNDQQPVTASASSSSNGEAPKEIATAPAVKAEEEVEDKEPAAEDDEEPAPKKRRTSTGRKPTKKATTTEKKRKTPQPRRSRKKKTEEDEEEPTSEQKMEEDEETKQPEPDPETKKAEEQPAEDNGRRRSRRTRRSTRDNTFDYD